jgi:hypothetical protein
MENEIGRRAKELDSLSIKERSRINKSAILKILLCIPIWFVIMLLIYIMEW